jgi:hypothetical protein
VIDLFSGWTSLTHVFMDLDTKEKAKQFWNFSAVPFYVVVSSQGATLASGSPKARAHFHPDLSIETTNR